MSTYYDRETVSRKPEIGCLIVFLAIVSYLLFFVAPNAPKIEDEEYKEYILTIIDTGQQYEFDNIMDFCVQDGVFYGTTKKEEIIRLGRATKWTMTTKTNAEKEK